MAISTEIHIVPLDFDAIRGDLQRFLQNQATLKDYNYAGSALSLLVDILAYDAYYHGWYTNFAVNETFLQTAQIRNSVVAAARQIGYLPRSMAGSLGITNITVGSVNPGEGTITIPKFAPFSAAVGGQDFTFYTLADYSQYTNGASSILFEGVELYEGVLLIQTFDINQVSNTGTVVGLLNQNVDTRTISVIVKPSPSSPLSYPYTKADSSVVVNATSNVFFLFETNDGTYDIQFGDGNLGRNLTVGQQVIVNYLHSRGGASVGANTFSYTGVPLGILSGTTNVSVVLNNINIPSYGGASREGIESIKRNAPNIYQAQGRIVTPYDARAILSAEVSGLDSVAVWGGEDHDPPTYGKMFIAMKPVNAERYGAIQKDYITRTVLRPKSLPTLSYELLDPDYIYIVVETQVRYTPAATFLSAEGIRQTVANTIAIYARDQLGQFGSYFRYSQLTSAIDHAETSIQSNLTTLLVEKRLITNAATGSYTLLFSNPLYHPSVTSNVVVVTSKVGTQRFTHPDEVGVQRRGCYIENVGTRLNVYRDTSSGSRLLTKLAVGTVNFETGTISFTRFLPTSITTNLINELRIQAIPRNSDIVPTRQQIILIPSDNIVVSIIDDLLNITNTTFGKVTAGGRLGAGSFTV